MPNRSARKTMHDILGPPETGRSKISRCNHAHHVERGISSVIFPFCLTDIVHNVKITSAMPGSVQVKNRARGCIRENQPMSFETPICKKMRNIH